MALRFLAKPDTATLLYKRLLARQNGAIQSITSISETRDVDAKDEPGNEPRGSRARSESGARAAHAFIAESEMLKRNHHDQFLQPSTLPTFYEKPVYSPHFLGLYGCDARAPPAKVDNNETVSDFLGESKTRQSVKLPLKAPKLSNPFPDPVKVAISPYVVTDDEKASQALEEARVARASRSAAPARKYHTASGGPVARRPYSNACEDECEKKKKTCVPEDHNVCRRQRPCYRICNKLKIKGCPDVRDPLTCKLPNLEVHCTKQEAPYPSFSEKCKMDPAPTLSECHNCPWSKRGHPYFQGSVKTKKFSTAALAMAQTGGNLSTTGESMRRYLSCVSNPQETFKLDRETVPWITVANISQLYRDSSGPAAAPYTFRLTTDDPDDEKAALNVSDFFAMESYRNNEIDADLLNSNDQRGVPVELKIDSGMLNTNEQSVPVEVKVDRSLSSGMIAKQKKSYASKINRLEDDEMEGSKGADAVWYSAPGEPSCIKQGCYDVKIDKKKCPKFPLKDCKDAVLPLNQDYLAPLKRRIQQGKEDGTHCKQFSSAEAFETFSAASGVALQDAMVLSGNNKKPQEQQPEYPRSCLRDFEDKTKICPSDIDKKKTRKDRLKKKKAMPFIPEVLKPSRLIEYLKRL